MHFFTLFLQKNLDISKKSIIFASNFKTNSYEQEENRTTGSR